MLIEIERVLRTEFHSAGQTELKSYLEQLSGRDGALPIGQQAIRGGIDATATDLSIGTSFELVDLSEPDPTEAQRSRSPAPERFGPPTPPPEVARSGNTAEIAKPGKGGAGRRKGGGFWFGVFFAVAAMIGIRVPAGVEREPGRAALTRPGGRRRCARRAARAGPDHCAGGCAGNARPGSPRRRAAARGAATVESGGRRGRRRAGGGHAPGCARRGGGACRSARPRRPPPTTRTSPTRRRCCGPPSRTPRTPSSARAGPRRPAAIAPATRRAPARPETAILHITSAPSGAVVRTTSRVLGRTPLNIHFRTGNIYEIAFIKAGYETATRRVAVRGTNDRKIAVSLRKRPPPKRTSFFHPHR